MSVQIHNCLFVLVTQLALLTGMSGAQEILTYTGRLDSLVRGEAPTAVKEFQVTCFVDVVEPQTSFYLVEESRFALPWIERAGLLAGAREYLSVEDVAIAYRHQERNYLLPVGLPHFADFDQLQPGAEWKNDQGEFRVTGQQEVNGQTCWEVRATTGIARHHTLFVRTADPIVEAANQTVFMGPGDRFQLAFRRESSTSLSAEDSQRIRAAIKTYLQLSNEIQREPHDRFRPLSNEQVAALAKHVDAFVQQAENTPLSRFSIQVRENLSLLTFRNQKLEGLSSEMVGQKIGSFTLESLQAEKIASSSFAGQTTVLHFWDYANSTLEQPYGQVGYLDFLHNRWKEKGVRVIGVAVNSQISDPESRQQAIREINKLKQFMRLSYEVTYDPGAVLNTLGNPTRFGEELPLWVVIAPDGTVAHYQTGFYEVDNRVGLKKLDEVVQQLAESQ